jgi:sigma-B regulation protein RsbU (phosphoserine phosphatase)
MFHPIFAADVGTVGIASASEWRWAIFSLGVAFVLLSIGLAALAVFALRRRTAGLLPLYFALFVIPYAARMILREGALRSIFSIPPGLAEHSIRVITYTIALPALFLFLQVVEKQWKKLFQWILGIHIVFSVVAILCEILGYAPVAVDKANSILVLAFWLVLMVYLFSPRGSGHVPKDLLVVRFGLAIFGFFVIHANLAALRLVPGRDIEPLGFLAFVCSLGYLVAHRIFAKEESLFAIQKELEIAEQIQTSILPREVPRIPGIEIAARYLPMSAVAGDFYDFLAPATNQLGVLIADVTGHGVPAALIASMLKVAFAGQAGHADDPARVLAGLNQALCGKFEDHFVTAAYVFIDLNRHVLRYAGAGHPPLLRSNRSNGAASSIEQNGLFLGMFPEATYESVELPLQLGDRYVLYTDGLPESKSAVGEEFGLQRCKQFLESHPRLLTGAFADALLGEISRWSARSAGGVQEDDMTLILLDCLEQA